MRTGNTREEIRGAADGARRRRCHGRRGASSGRYRDARPPPFRRCGAETLTAPAATRHGAPSVVARQSSRLSGVAQEQRDADRGHALVSAAALRATGADPSVPRAPSTGTRPLSIPTSRRCRPHLARRGQGIRLVDPERGRRRARIPEADGEGHRRAGAPLTGRAFDPCGARITSSSSPGSGRTCPSCSR